MSVTSFWKGTHSSSSWKHEALLSSHMPGSTTPLCPLGSRELPSHLPSAAQFRAPRHGLGSPFTPLRNQNSMQCQSPTTTLLHRQLQQARGRSCHGDVILHSCWHPPALPVAVITPGRGHPPVSPLPPLHLEKTGWESLCSPCMAPQGHHEPSLCPPNGGEPRLWGIPCDMAPLVTPA